MTAVGGIIGTIIVPGVGTAVGAFVGNVIDRALVAVPTKKRVFISFDYNNDVGLKHFIVQQSMSDKSPFEIIDCSLVEAAPEADWVEHAAMAIAGADLVMVITGRNTYRSIGVLIEVAMAKRLGIRCVQIRAHRYGYCPSVPDAGRMYNWDWAQLDKILA